MASLQQTRSPELRRDPVTDRWVLFSPGRAKRPSDFKSKTPQTPNSDSNTSCPFCIGNEDQCAPEIFRVPEDPNWKIRAIQNLYPALSRDLHDPNGSGFDSESRLPGFGFHDVVIESPVHSIQLMDLDENQIGEVLIAYKKRIEQVMSYDSVKYVQVFKNHGASAGASMSHSHSQMLTLPIIPPSACTRIHGMKEYFKKMGKCCLCEDQKKELLIDESTHFIAIVPFAATFAFEIWIIPRDHSPHFHELDSEKVIDLGRLLKLMLKKMSQQLNNPPFNFMIQTSPFKLEESHQPYSHWFLQIIPQLTTVAGFEIGTGCHINPVFPEDAAKVLREVKLNPDG